MHRLISRKIVTMMAIEGVRMNRRHGLPKSLRNKIWERRAHHRRGAKVSAIKIAFRRYPDRHRRTCEVRGCRNTHPHGGTIDFSSYDTAWRPWLCLKCYLVIAPRARAMRERIGIGTWEEALDAFNELEKLAHSASREFRNH
jgi:hypothetical protein